MPGLFHLQLAGRTDLCTIQGMYEFPPSSELSHLISDELMQVCLDPHSTQFRFERNSITSEFDIEHVEPDGSVWRYESTASTGPAIMLHRLVQKKIAALHSEGLKLSVIFDNGAELRFFSEIGPYECGQIGGEGKLIIF